MTFCDTCQGYLDDPEYCADCTAVDDYEEDYYYNDREVDDGYYE